MADNLTEAKRKIKLEGAKLLLHSMMPNFPGLNSDQQAQTEKLLMNYTEHYFKDDVTLDDAFRVAADEVTRFHLPFIENRAAPTSIRSMALSVFKEIGFDLELLPRNADNAEIVATAVVAWSHYVREGARSRDAAWRVVGELGDVVGEPNAK